MNDASHWAVRRIADRVGDFLRRHIELGCIRNELARDRIGQITRVDQLGHRRRDRHRIPRGHRFEVRQTRRVDQAGVARAAGVRSVSANWWGNGRPIDGKADLP